MAQQTRRDATNAQQDGRGEEIGGKEAGPARQEAAKRIERPSCERPSCERPDLEPRRFRTASDPRTKLRQLGLLRLRPDPVPDSLSQGSLAGRQWQIGRPSNLCTKFPGARQTGLRPNSPPREPALATGLASPAVRRRAGAPDRPQRPARTISGQVWEGKAVIDVYVLRISMLLRGEPASWRRQRRGTRRFVEASRQKLTGLQTGDRLHRGVEQS